jgi:hypothetical protein
VAQEEVGQPDAQLAELGQRVDDLVGDEMEPTAPGV